MASKKLVPPKNLHIDFKPSPKQYELWKLLQPECPLCGGEIEQKLIGYDTNHNPKYKAALHQVWQFQYTATHSGWRCRW